MKFGTYFAYWEKEWETDFSPYCKKVARLGFDVLEVSGGGIAAMEDSELLRLKTHAKNSGITLTCCIGLGRDLDVSSADESIRQNGIRFVKHLLDNMDKAGIRLLGGIIYAYWPVDYSRPVNKALARAQSLKSMAELADYAKALNITLALEIVNRFEQFLLNDAAEGMAFVDALGKDNVKLLLDCFHMNIEEDNIGDAIRNAGPYIGHFHIGEANRKVPGKGHMPWDEIACALKDVGYDGGIVMEPFVQPGGTVGHDIKVWRDLSDNADEAKLDADIAEALVFLKSKFI